MMGMALQATPPLAKPVEVVTIRAEQEISVIFDMPGYPELVFGCVNGQVRAKMKTPVLNSYATRVAFQWSGGKRGVVMSGVSMDGSTIFVNQPSKLLSMAIKEDRLDVEWYPEPLRSLKAAFNLQPARAKLQRLEQECK